MSSEAEDPRGENSGYSVGYGKPPKEHHFQKGRSPNPRGRRREKRTIYDVLHEMLENNVSATNDTRMLGQELVARRVIALAMKCDSRAFREFIRLARRADLFNDIFGRPKPDGDIRKEIEELRRQLAEFE